MSIKKPSSFSLSHPDISYLLRHHELGNTYHLISFSQSPADSKFVKSFTSSDEAELFLRQSSLPVFLYSTDEIIDAIPLCATSIIDLAALYGEASQRKEKAFRIIERLASEAVDDADYVLLGASCGSSMNQLLKDLVKEKFLLYIFEELQHSNYGSQSMPIGRQCDIHGYPISPGFVIISKVERSFAKEMLSLCPAEQDPLSIAKDILDFVMARLMKKVGVSFGDFASMFFSDNEVQEAFASVLRHGEKSPCSRLVV